MFLYIKNSKNLLYLYNTIVYDFYVIVCKDYQMLVFFLQIVF